MAKKEEKKDLLENAEIIQEKIEGIEHWAESNPKIIIGVVAVIVLIVGGYFGWNYYIDSQEAEAQKEMFQERKLKNLYLTDHLLILFAQRKKSKR